MNKKDCEKLIDKLADKTLSFGCWAKHRHGHDMRFNGEWWDFIKGGEVVGHTTLPPNEDEVLGHPIMIGNVLERITTQDEVNDMSEIGDMPTDTEYLILLWAVCGFTKSLQEIVREIGWEEVEESVEVFNKEIKHDMDCLRLGLVDGLEVGEKIQNTSLPRRVKQLKDPSARKLFEFLNEIL